MTRVPALGSGWEEGNPFPVGKGGADADLGVPGSLSDGEMVEKGKKILLPFKRI